MGGLFNEEPTVQIRRVTSTESSQNQHQLQQYNLVLEN